MREFLFLMTGGFVGSVISVGSLCCLQVHRISQYEREINRLKAELKEKE